ncbi:hypothetical protein BpHYR1_031024 [Brachionus plicatilis]|uniref:Uncharacterized protein n=1 Tax=Brachionus plicatilis TaxID=10195 RepID=A0A3M7PJ20_BRAPC|nr:hypothetical protein BpHYR1_031024 [Brachionus plicatilis]
MLGHGERVAERVRAAVQTELVAKVGVKGGKVFAQRELVRVVAVGDQNLGVGERSERPVLDVQLLVGAQDDDLGRQALQSGAHLFKLGQPHGRLRLAQRAASAVAKAHADRVLVAQRLEPAVGPVGQLDQTLFVPDKNGRVGVREAPVGVPHVQLAFFEHAALLWLIVVGQIGAARLAANRAYECGDAVACILVHNELVALAEQIAADGQPDCHIVIVVRVLEWKKK